MNGHFSRLALCSSVALLGLILVSCDSELAERVDVLEEDVEERVNVLEKGGETRAEELKVALEVLMETVGEQQKEIASLQETLSHEARKSAELQRLAAQQAQTTTGLLGAFDLMERAIAERGADREKAMLAQARAEAKRLADIRKQAEPIKMRIAQLEEQEQALLAELARFNNAPKLMFDSMTPSSVSSSLIRKDQEFKARFMKSLRQRLDPVVQALDRENAKMDALYSRR